MSVLFLDKNYVISSHGVSSGDIFYNEVFECQDFKYQDIIDIDQEIYGNEIYYTKNLNVNTLIRGGQRAGETLIYISPLNHNRFNKSMMIAHIPISNIEKTIKGRIETSPCSVTLYDKDNQSIMHILSGEAVHNIAKELTYVSPVNGWQYKMNIPTSAYNHAKHNIRIGVSIISLLVLIIIVLIAYYLSSNQVAPLRDVQVFGILSQ